MTVYCANGAEPKPYLPGTTTPMPDVIQIGVELLTAAALIGTDTEWLMPFLEPIIGSYLTTATFCAVAPQEPPPTWTAAIIAVPILGQAAAAAWANYFLWVYLCRCKPGGPGACEYVHYGDNVKDWGGYFYDYGTYGAGGSFYDLTISHPTEGESLYGNVEGPIGWMWNLPTSEGGTESGGSHAFRLLGGVTAMSYPDLTYATAPRPLMTDAVYGADQSQFVITICPHAETAPVVPPPVLGPPIPPGVINNPAPG